MQEPDQGKSVQEICKNHGISQPTFYQWKSKYSGMDANQLKRLKELEAELGQFKRMDTDLAFENNALKKLIEKKF